MQLTRNLTNSWRMGSTVEWVPTRYGLQAFRYPQAELWSGKFSCLEDSCDHLWFSIMHIDEHICNEKGIKSGGSLEVPSRR